MDSICVLDPCAFIIELFKLQNLNGKLSHSLRIFSVNLFCLVSTSNGVHNHSYVCRYLSALVSQSFLDIGSVSRILDGIMKLCVQFCWKIENQENKEITTELEHIAEVLQE